ncbi:MAG: hypothetical protein EA377_04850 [Phycisphaerales bacterium]|nr:MAG: hypothetical protein EA377_04850 [Phycisphaerales bacterium]
MFMASLRSRTAAGITPLACSALLAVSLTATTAAIADDCTPTWDAEFGLPGAPSSIVFDFAEHNGELYAVGGFTSIGGVAANRVARWNGNNWSALGSGLSNNEVYGVASFGGDLYVAGYFDSAGGTAGTAKLARWNGTTWQSLGAQLDAFFNQLWGLTTWDDGNGEALYIAGNYVDIAGIPDASFITRYDGTTFSALGAPIGGNVPLIVFSVYPWDDGSGEALYIGGRFLNVDGVPANRIARWDGENWSALGSGISGTPQASSVMDMVAFDDGTGEQLYVAGQAFSSAGGETALRVARWDGSSWSAVGDGFADGIVWGLQVFDDGQGPSLYAFGTFTASGSTPLSRVARWNGTSWKSVGDGANGAAYRAIAHDDGSGSAMYVGGAFTSIAGTPSNRIARLIPCERDGVLGDLNDDGVVNVFDLLILLGEWGPCADPNACPADLNNSGGVDVFDLLLLLSNWG